MTSTRRVNDTASATAVIEDSPQDTSPGNPIWRMVGIAASVLLTAIAFFALDFETSVDQLTTTTTTPLTLAERVPDLEGTMHLITADGAGGVYLRWGAGAAEPTRTPLPVPAGRLNVDASQIAALAPAPTGPGSDLWIGTPADLRPSLENVLTFVWHDEAPDRLAATRALDGVNELWLGDARASDSMYTFERAGALPDEAVLTGYGAWGVSLSIEAGDTVLVVDQYASLVRQYAGSAVGQQPGDRGGVIMATGDGASIEFRASTVELPIPAGGTLRGLDWIDGTARAVANVLDNGIPMVRVIEGDRLLTESRIDAEQVRWAPGARHIVITTPDGELLVFDTAGSTVIPLPMPGGVSDAMVTED